MGTGHVDELVAARWADVESVALVATLDRGAARALVAATFTDLARRWREVSAGGTPARDARAGLLDRVARSPDPVRTAPDDRLREAAADTSTAVPGRLLDALAAEPPLVRAVLAADVVWDLSADGLRDVLGARADRVAPEVAAARDRLLGAHRDARRSDGQAPSDDRLAGDLADLVRRLAATADDVPDPATLRADTARTRRRTLLLGAAGATVLGGAAAWVLGRSGAGAAPTTPPVPPLPSAADRAWDRTATWPARGSLRGDRRIPAVLVDPTDPAARTLYAGDVAGARVVVASDGRTPVGRVWLWTGPAGAPPEQLAAVPLAPDSAFLPVPVVSVGVPTPGGAAVLVLAGPATSGAEVSPTVRPTAAGTLDRDWVPVQLEGGVGVLERPDPPGPAAVVRCAGQESPLLRPRSWDPPPDDAGGAEAALVRYVVAATGIPADRLDTGSSTYTLPEDVALSGAATKGTVTIRLHHVTTPQGAVFRSATVTGTSAGTTTVADGGRPSLLPADAADVPYLVPLADDLTGGSTYGVVTPPGAATVRLYGTGRDAEALGPEAPVTRRAAVVRTTVYEPPGRILVRDAAGAVLYDGLDTGSPL